MKKSAIGAALAVLGMAALMFAGCSNILDPPQAQGAGTSGSARIIIRLEPPGGLAGGERTLQPKNMTVDAFVIKFTKSGEQNPFVTIDNPTLSSGVYTYSGSLAQGTWDITVEGLQEGIPVIEGEKTIAITSPAAVMEAVIDEWAPVTGTGLFVYDLNCGGAVAGSLAIFELDGTTPVAYAPWNGSAWGVETTASINNLKTRPSGYVQLAAGFYLVTVDIRFSSARRKKTEALHIYPGEITQAAGAPYRFYEYEYFSVAEMKAALIDPGMSAAGTSAVDCARVNLRYVELGGGQTTDQNGDTLGLLFDALGGKYVALDLSSCTGLIPGLSSAASRIDGDKLVSLFLPGTVTVIGDYVFSGCSELAETGFPENLETIGVEAFKDCALTAVDLPQSVREIEAGAFDGCNSLETITLQSGAPPVLGVDALGSSLTAIYVPRGKFAAYTSGNTVAGWTDAYKALVQER
ncbi:MAG: leucine-rich repeat domain-containing protein [Treponema sp.]|jgi:hypothetical protein|nr:leucine-rich repeat domain-containing protein [Treponema sp.]